MIRYSGQVWMYGLISIVYTYAGMPRRAHTESVSLKTKTPVPVSVSIIYAYIIHKLNTSRLASPL